MIVLLAFVLAEGNKLTVRDLEAAAVIYTILLGVLHTGIVYTIFFSLTTQMTVSGGSQSGVGCQSVANRLDRT